LNRSIKNSLNAYLHLIKSKNIYNDMFDNYKIVDIDKNILSDSERRIFDNFVGLLKDTSSKIVYRGEQRVEEIYCCNNIDELLYKIFLIGCKGEHFWKQRSKYYTKTICKKIFEQLFKDYSRILNSDNIESVRTKEHLLQFKKKNESFCLYFTNHANIQDMWDKVKVRKQSERQKLLNYYIAILHGIGHIALHGSPMISTSQKLDVANKFQNNGIVFVSWITKEKELVPVYDINSVFSFAKQLKLPTCSPSVFPEDSEICISYGLLPHKILGVIYRDNFYINPNLFSVKRTLEDSIKMGFYIDQTNFSEELKLTKFKRAFDVYAIGEEIVKINIQ